MKLPQLTFTRFLAAILIVVSHIHSQTLDNLPIIGPLAAKAPAMVSYFFLLSGFILVVSNASGTALPDQIPRRKFWINRFARIYPLHLFAFLATFLLAYPTLSVNTKDLPWGMATFIPEITLTNAWVLSWVPSLNYPNWSISVEAVFYLLFPSLFQWLVHKRSPQIIIFISLVWIANQLIYAYCFNIGTTANICLYLPLLHLSTFICGVGTGVLTLRHWQILMNSRSIITAFSLILLLVTVYLITIKAPIMMYYHDGLLAPLFIVLILFLTVQQGTLARWLSKPKLVYLGEISYGIYLLQIPVGLAATSLNHRYMHLSPNQYVPVYFVLLLLISALCFEKIEAPARYSLRQWLSGAKYANQQSQQKEYASSDSMNNV